MAELYLDLGWHFGWCLVRRGDRITHGHVDLTKQSRIAGVKLRAKAQWLTALLGQLDQAGEKLTECRFEQITFVGNNAAEVVHVHGFQQGIVRYWWALKGLPGEPRGIAWDVVKRHITGHRSAAAETVRDEVAKFFPTVTDLNEASAIAVMHASTGRRLGAPAR